MNKIRNLILAALAFVAMLCGFAAIAAETPAASYATVSTGSATWTNATPYSVLTLGRIYVTGIQPADATVTVARVSTIRSAASTNTIAITNTIATIVCTSNAGVSTNISRYVHYGDKLVCTGVGTNAGYVTPEGTFGP